MAVAATVNFMTSVFNFLLVVTMANVSHAVGAKAWNVVAMRIRVALGTAVVVGVVIGGALYLLQHTVLDTVMGLNVTVAQEAKPYFLWRIGALPLKLLGSTCAGVLSGYQRINTLMAINTLALVLDCGLNYVALFVLGRGLQGSGEATFTATAVFAVLALLLVTWQPPASAEEPIKIWCGGGGDGSNTGAGNNHTNSDDDSGSGRDSGGSAWKTTPPVSAIRTTTIGQYFRDSGFMFARSLLLQASVYSMAVTASNLGTAQLSAHAVLVQLWMLTSYVVDGFADVATFLVGNMLGSNDPPHRIRGVAQPLFVMGVVTGVGCGATMFGFRDGIINLFTNHAPVHDELVRCWAWICAMQLPNAAVFYLDGILAARRAFKFTAGLHVVAVTCVFTPLLCWGYLEQKELLDIWFAKVALNAARLTGAFYYTRDLWYPCFYNDAGHGDYARMGGLTSTAAARVLDEQHPLLLNEA